MCAPGLGKKAPDGAMDNASPENIAALKQFAQTIIDDNKAKIDAMVAMIKADLAHGPAVTDVNPPSDRRPSLTHEEWKALPPLPPTGTPPTPPAPPPANRLRIAGR